MPSTNDSKTDDWVEVYTCRAETQFECLRQNRRVGGVDCIFQRCLSNSFPLTCSFCVTFTLVAWGHLCPFPLYWVDLCGCLDQEQSMLLKACVWVLRFHHKNLTYFFVLFSWSVYPWNPATMLWACPSLVMERYPWRGNEVLAHFLSWASSCRPASTCQPSWKWILQLPAKLLQMLACGMEMSSPTMPCPVCRFMI